MSYEELNGIVWLKRNNNKQSSKQIEMNSTAPDSKENFYREREEESDEYEDDEENDYGVDDEIILNDQDVWDDSILIQMYEQSQREIAEALRKKHSNHKNKTNANNNDSKIKQQTTTPPPPPQKPATVTITTSSSSNTNNAKKSKNKKFSQPNKTVTQDNSTSKQQQQQQYQTINWKQGDYCRLIYTEDNIEYEAQIIELNHSNGQCLVRYIGYENEEWRQLSELRSSAGNNFREMQIQMAIKDGYGNIQQEQPENETGDYTEYHNQPNEFMTGTSRIIPPPPPFFGLNPQLSSSNNQSIMMNEEDTLASMLMSWYMTGYHTGYFQAQRDIRKSNTMNNCRCHCSTKNRQQND